MTAFERAAALLAQRKPAEAAQAFERLLEADPANPEIIFHASVALAAAGDYQGALRVALQGTQLHPQWWRGHAQAGALLLALNRPEQAIPHLERARELTPAHMEILNNLGAAYRAARRPAAALAVFEAAVAIDAADENVARNYAAALTAEGRHAQAATVLKRLIDAGRASADLFDTYGKIIWKLGDVEGALAWFGRALAVDPGFADALAHRGSALMELGDMAEGMRSLRAAIEIEPHPEFYRVLVEVDIKSITDDDVAAIETLTGSDADYARARIYAARGDHQRGFRHMLAANSAVRATLSYDERDTLGVMSRMPAFFPRSVLERPRTSGNPSNRPIFIVGMPRSGTTLIEQILASHPSVYGAGELSLFAEISEAVLARLGVSPEHVPGNDAALRQIGDEYLAAIATIAPNDALRVTDKMPDNFRAVGLIALALPNAAIIHARRDPLETCLSCFSISFADRTLAWTYDLNELGRYYRAYDALMDYWQQALPPGKMLDVEYESVVDDLEGQARRIVAFCGLDWDDRCLSFYETKRPVRTASVAQVRQPIYRSSLKRAEKYGDLLQPLIDQLRA
jgi:tetratricopeptide (TPR) repeat protein